MPGAIWFWHRCLVLSVGGYDKEKEERIATGEKAGFETVKAVSRSLDRVLQALRDESAGNGHKV